jgi:ribosome production factor 1
MVKRKPQKVEELEESTDESFSDDSDASDSGEEKPKLKNKKDSDSSDSDSDDAGPDEKSEEEPPKKRKTLQDYLNEKAARQAIEDAANESDDEEKVAFPVINPVNYIKNKEVRHKKFKRDAAAKKKEEKKGRKERKKEPGPKSKGHTIESLREKDQTTVEDLNNSDNEETRKELELDEYDEYFNKIYAPKVLITYSDNPHSKTRGFGKELTRIIPNSIALTRHRSSVKKICASAIREGYTDLIIINENRKQVNGLLLIHLPGGPTAHFKVSNVKLTKDIKRKLSDISAHRPEVVLTNFTTRLGLQIGRMLGAIFHFDPEFKGRRCVTFHNQRDYIFFRHHLYQFDKNGQRVKLREQGPRFTLKLRSLQQGLFDSKTGDYEWMITNKRHQLESNRRRFYL